MIHPVQLLSPAELRNHWEGHRRLTRRTLEVFPEDALFHFCPAPPMRSFGAMTLEVIGMIEPTLRGLVGGNWSWTEAAAGIDSKAALLEAWDHSSAALESEWPKVKPERLGEVEAVFGLPPQKHLELVWYLIDNEIHHRAQGYVYLRLLGIEPPAFFER
ncbi:putative damage-inducible protein DinB [Deinobacterium chartae]|uniref:Putative damage-inducible protein DinB n=1 Tax=Deinobacterium chartae TaxID=521158 RepID=A0A841HUK7_9DEIO|nr:DinB family protein [Deinobacterium chartae]MBB6097141.1 putative damage-inducible protein DinB [Deinobacterium chartae]